MDQILETYVLVLAYLAVAAHLAMRIQKNVDPRRWDRKDEVQA